MKAIVFLIFLSFAPAGFAQGAPNGASRVDQIRKLENEFLALNYAKSRDRNKGMAKFDLVLKRFDQFRFNMKSKSFNKDEFRALVDLVAAALPYDMETEGVENLLDLVTNSSDMKALYEAELSDLKDSCRQKFLKNVMDERMCYAENEKTDVPESENTRCIRNFDYAKCIGVRIPN